MPRLIDLSHDVEHGMVTYKGLPAPIVCDFLSREDSKRIYAPGTEFHIGKIEMVANTGTYLDAPFHRYADGKDLSELALESVADLDAVVVRAPMERGRAIGPEAFAARALKGKAVLVHTGWSRHWRTDRYFEGHPFLTAEAAALLRDQGAALVGIDSLNIDDIAGGQRPVHSTLLRADIPIVEHMTGLDQVPDAGFRFHAVPVKVKKFGTFPVRAYAVVD
ncbi:MAG TPA: cyclase family protein [Methylomirabilota bacterium]|jgi:kynurenine formamidase|nr:cyclase family protein [Methylomirabilota bacterium]